MFESNDMFYILMSYLNIYACWDINSLHKYGMHNGKTKMYLTDNKPSITLLCQGHSHIKCYAAVWTISFPVNSKGTQV